ncbi:AMP-binding protein, partial [Granulicella sp. L60]|uniref:AMP-binding protein n=1 Tax=Granulicella sp. L60 TaxID=1641866 RepID=UPI00210F4746
MAYIIYTSGSTGAPKGVMVEHKNIVNYLIAIGEKICISDRYSIEGLRFGLISTFAADLGYTVLFSSLCRKGKLYIFPVNAPTDASSFASYCKNNLIDVIKITPSHLQALWAKPNDSSLLPAKRLIFGGEVLTNKLLNSVRSLNTKCQIYNHYGPTECTVGVLTGDITTLNQDLIEGNAPIGRPIANTQIYILDGQGEPVPVGVAGEMYIGGAGVARGYLNRPELTAEKFLRDPFVDEAGARMYRTGDLGRWRSDGNIEFLGRNDFQVKIRGYRIELGEIESRLMEHPDVREGVVIAREDVPGDKRLVAYYTASTGDDPEAPDAGRLRAHLSADLPEYMVPAAYVRLESLPLTPNGKLDRKALPAPDTDAYAYAVRGYEPPQGEIEIRLAAIWADVLKLERVGRHDNFFELGGHSLLAVRVVTRLQQVLGVEVAIRDLFAHPEVADLAYALGSAAQIELPSISSVERTEHLPLSFSQQRLWFLSQMDGVHEAYHLPMGLRLKGDLSRL